MVASLGRERSAKPVALHRIAIGHICLACWNMPPMKVKAFKMNPSKLDHKGTAA